MNQGVAWHGIVFDGQGSTINSSVAPKTCPFLGSKMGPESGLGPCFMRLSRRCAAVLWYWRLGSPPCLCPENGLVFGPRFN